MIYLIGSLKNPEVPIVANRLRAEGHEVFDDWFSAGKDADDFWMDYEKGRGHNFKQALEGFAAHHVFEFDKKHLERADTVVLLLPAGKSGHLELGWALGKGKKGYIVYGQEPPRFDVMYLFADKVFVTVEELVEELRNPGEAIWQWNPSTYPNETPNYPYPSPPLRDLVRKQAEEKGELLHETYGVWKALRLPCLCGNQDTTGYCSKCNNS